MVFAGCIWCILERILSFQYGKTVLFVILVLFIVAAPLLILTCIFCQGFLLCSTRCSWVPIHILTYYLLFAAVGASGWRGKREPHVVLTLCSVMIVGRQQTVQCSLNCTFLDWSFWTYRLKLWTILHCYCEFPLRTFLPYMPLPWNTYLPWNLLKIDRRIWFGFKF